MRIKKLEQINKETIKLPIIIVCLIGIILEVFMPVLYCIPNISLFGTKFLSLSGLRNIARYISLIIFCGIILLSDNKEVKQNTKYLMGVQLVQLLILKEVVGFLTEFIRLNASKIAGGNIWGYVISYSQIPFSYFLLFIEVVLYIVLLKKSKGMIKKIYWIMVSIVILTEVYPSIHSIVYILMNFGGNNHMISFYSTLIFRVIVSLLYIAGYLITAYLIRTSDTLAIENKSTI